MSDLLQQGAAWLDSQRHGKMTQTVEYFRGVNSVELAATIGRTEFDQADESGFIQQLESRDFIIRVSDLVISAATVQPQPGDRIKETNGSGIEVYEVMAFGGEPPWRYSDLYRIAYRIHTKHVATEVDGP